MRFSLLVGAGVFACGLLGFTAACGPRSGGSGFADGRNPAGGGDTLGGDSDGGASPFGEAGGLPAGGGADCSDAAKLVYVLSEERGLYSFNPSTLAFKSIGTLDCQASGMATPNSMAVARDGTAWVNYTDGSLFKVSTSNAKCTSTSFVPPAEFTRFGMAFASDSAGSTEETLYISGLDDLATSGHGLYKIDRTTLVASHVGDFTGSLAGAGGELTGTGEGRLFGFFTTSPASLAEVSKTTGATSNAKSLAGVTTGTDFAFSFWGGDFWFYTADILQSTGDTSDITRLKTATDGSQSVVARNVGFRIVGAGVSTCAPTAPVK